VEKTKTNIIDSFANHPFLNQTEKKLLENLAYLNPRFANYWGREDLQIGQVIRTYFRLENKISSKEELEEKLISHEMFTTKDNIKVGETIDQTAYGKMYFLSSKEPCSKLAVYFINP
jgi:hypothetical protein